jgi:hypothetical protein
MYGRFRCRRDEFASLNWRMQRVEQKGHALRLHHRNIRRPCAWITEPEWGAFGRAGMPQVRAIWGRVRGEVPVYEAVPGMRSRSPAMKMFGRLDWTYEQSDQGDERNRSLNANPHCR